VRSSDLINGLITGGGLKLPVQNSLQTLKRTRATYLEEHGDYSATTISSSVTPPGSGRVVSDLSHVSHAMNQNRSRDSHSERVEESCSTVRGHAGEVYTEPHQVLEDASGSDSFIASNLPPSSEVLDPQTAFFDVPGQNTSDWMAFGHNNQYNILDASPELQPVAYDETSRLSAFFNTMSHTHCFVADILMDSSLFLAPEIDNLSTTMVLTR
jgi:hypothetical protein